MTIRHLTRLTGYSRQWIKELATRGLIKADRLNDAAYLNRIVPLLKLRKSLCMFGARLKEAA